MGFGLQSKAAADQTPVIVDVRGKTVENKSQVSSPTNELKDTAEMLRKIGGLLEIEIGPQKIISRPSETTREIFCTAELCTAIH